MSRRRKAAVWFVMGLCSMWGVSVFATDYTGTLGAGDGIGFARFGVSPEATPKVKVGVQVLYVDGIEMGDMDHSETYGYGPGFFGMYDLVQDADFAVVGFKAPVTWYVGVQGNGLFLNTGKFKVSPGLMTGLFFGRNSLTAEQVQNGQKWAASFGVEEQYFVGPDLWQPLADPDRKFQTVVFAQLTWK